MASNTEDSPGEGSPGVVALPPLVYLGFLLAGGIVEFLVPMDNLPQVVQFPLGGVLAVASFLIVLPTMRRFRRAGTPFDVYKQASELITSGPNRFSRNPGYLALALLYAGISIAADSIWMLALLLPTVLVIHFGVILREERHLEALFGSEYLEYKARVRRWI